MAKINIEDIREELKKEGWNLFSEEYQNLDSELLFCCDEGHEFISTWKKIRNKRECPICKKNVHKDNTKVIPKNCKKRTLALDQSTRINGWAVYDDDRLVRYGVFTTQKEEQIDRCVDVKNWLISMVDLWRPDFIALEGIQYQKEVGVTTFEMLARLQGILMMTCKEMDIKFGICPTNTWRHHCGVKGRTRTDKKRSMQILAKGWFDVSVSEDEADAIGIGKYAAEELNVDVEIFNWE